MTQEQKRVAIIITAGLALASLTMAILNRVKASGLQKELLAKHKDAFLDPVTNNVLCSFAGKVVKSREKLKEKLVTKEVCGETVQLRSGVMEKFLRANEKMEAKTGKCIKITRGQSLRTNQGQIDVCQRLKDVGLKTPCSPPCLGFHEAGLAVDVGNWEEAQPFLWAEGFVGGTKGIRRDWWHFSIGELKPKGAWGRVKMAAEWKFCKDNPLSYVTNKWCQYYAK